MYSRCDSGSDGAYPSNKGVLACACRCDITDIPPEINIDLEVI